ncbi:hypothetical protein HSB1_17380 [Halogranum salarium B-1]|uniref:Uncharacterized protein n=1 Tax=Halogranum salarium B-1 TaxID=1210908 RepID=J2ZFV7_9EURY|nr:hypothetical protein HSB1_17380 [Halogranum salarium B-1]
MARKARANRRRPRDGNTDASRFEAAQRDSRRSSAILGARIEHRLQSRFTVSPAGYDTPSQNPNIGTKRNVR